jgi:hypothetical protein
MRLEQPRRMTMTNEWPERMRNMVQKGQRAQREVDEILSKVKPRDEFPIEHRSVHEVLRSASWYLRGRQGALLNAQRSTLDFGSELFEVRHAELIIVAAMTLVDAENAFAEVIKGPLPRTR